MIIIFAIDALEYDKVGEFECKNLMQKHYGKTDISEFSEPRTMVLWSSFMTGKNKEKEVLKDGNEEMWDKKWPLEETFFSNFKKPVVLDLPGFSYDKKVHDRSREVLKSFFETKDLDEKEKIRKEYNKEAFEHHKKIKKEFLRALDDKNKHDLVLGYFNVADVIGHLSFGNKTLMKIIYKELDEMAEQIAEKGKLVILSDHGMKAIGIFGEHSTYGFWSTNFDAGLKNKKPKITDFYNLINSLKK